MDVAAADRDVVDVVRRIAVARQHALDRDLGVLAPLAADAAQAVVEVQLDRRAADRLALAGAVEDDVLHRLAAQRRGLRLAQHPAHGVDDVGLAAAVGADDADELSGRRDRRGVDERLEAGELDLREAQGRTSRRSGRDAPVARRQARTPAVFSWRATRGRLAELRDESGRIIAESRVAPARRPRAPDGDGDRHRARRQPALLDGMARDLAPPPVPPAAAPGSRAGSARWQAGSADETCSPDGGSSGFGTSPATAVRASPVISRSGTASSSIRVYGCCGIREEVARGRELDDAAEVHDADAVGDVVDDGEIVRDEEVREPEPPLQVAHQVQHLRLHRHVERRRRLVADEERRVRRQRARDRDALPLAARELVRILRAVGRREADLLQQRGHARRELRARRCPARARAAARRRCRRRASAD